MFANILSFYKASRVKNRIINILERRTDLTGDALKNVIDADLKDYGYKITIRPVNCDRVSKSGDCTSPYGEGNQSEFKYCICRIEDTKNKGYHYEVITYTQFEFPIIGELLSYPVRGETRILGIDYDKE